MYHRSTELIAKNLEVDYLVNDSTGEKWVNYNDIGRILYYVMRTLDRVESAIDKEKKNKLKESESLSSS